MMVKPYTSEWLEKYDLGAHAIPILLTSYKYGITEIPSDITLLRKIAKNGWAKINLGRKSLCMLTDKGAEFVENNLFEMIANHPLFLSYSALVVGDEIQLLKDITKDDKLLKLSSVAVAMDRGRYFLAQINHGLITVVDDCDVPYSLSLSVSSNILVFRGDQLKTVDEEIKKRFHPIRIKSLTKRLSETVNSLTLTEWVEELYDKRHIKWRIGGQCD